MNPASPPAYAPSPWESPNTESEPPRAPGGGIPWEYEQSINALFQTMKVVLLEPSQTFASAAPRSGIGPAFIYALILGVIGGTIGVGWQALAGLGGVEDLPEGMEALAFFAAPGLGALVTIPIGIVIGLFVWSGIVHLALTVAGGANHGFEATFRSVAFAQGSASLLQIVPFAGAMIGGIWALVVEIIALKELHGTSGGKAALAVLLPIVLCCCCAAAVAIIAAGAVGAAAGFAE